MLVLHSPMLCHSCHCSGMASPNTPGETHGTIQKSGVVEVLVQIAKQFPNNAPFLAPVAGTLSNLVASGVGCGAGMLPSVCMPDIPASHVMPSVAQLASVLPRPPHRIQGFGGGGARQDLGSLRHMTPHDAT